jgi:hypothetical protein
MNPFAPLTRIQKLLNIRTERRDPRRLKVWTVEEAGLRVRQDAAETFIPWDQVSELVAFKRDYGFTDQVCLGFRQGRSDAYTVLEEDNPAWETVLAATEARFPLPGRWLDEVMEPPFACNWTCLWGQAPEMRQSG